MTVAGHLHRPDELAINDSGEHEVLSIETHVNERLVECADDLASYRGTQRHDGIVRLVLDEIILLDLEADINTRQSILSECVVENVFFDLGERHDVDSHRAKPYRTLWSNVQVIHDSQVKLVLVGIIDGECQTFDDTFDVWTVEDEQWEVHG
ncbi:hypothetical protein D9M70_488170 [compost metagenome]